MRQPTAWRIMLVIVCVVSSLSPARADMLRLDYEGFTIWLDCERRGAVKFRYNAQRAQTLPTDLHRPLPSSDRRL
jgi:hypothetical protein